MVAFDTYIILAVKNKMKTMMMTRKRKAGGALVGPQCIIDHISNIVQPLLACFLQQLNVHKQ